MPTSLRSIARGGHTKAACSILNPFCLAAKGAPRPDGMGHATFPFQVRGSFPLSTDSSGNAFIAVVPGCGLYGYAAATIAGLTATMAATWSTLPGSAFLTTNAEDIRIVSMGSTFRSTASMTNCQGLLHTFQRAQLKVGQAFPILSENNIEDQLSPLTSGYAVSQIAKPVGNQAHQFIAFSTLNNTMAEWNWSVMCYEVINSAPSIGIGYIEIVVNIEMTLNLVGTTTTGLGGVVRPVKPANPIALQAQALVHSTTPSIIQGGYESVERAITNAAGKAIDTLWSNAESFGLSLLGL